MAKKGNKLNMELPDQGDEATGTRVKADYVFEDHHPDGTVTQIGLTLHYPSEAKQVQAFLEYRREELGIEGVIRICKKIYS